MLITYCNYLKKQNKKVITLIVVNVGNLDQTFILVIFERLEAVHLSIIMWKNKKQRIYSFQI